MLVPVVPGKDALLLRKVDALVVHDVLDPLEEPVHERDRLLRVVLEPQLAQHIPQAGEPDPDAPRVEAGLPLFGEWMFVGVVVEDIVEEASGQTKCLLQVKPVHLSLGGKLVLHKFSEPKIAETACSVRFKRDL